MITFQQINCFLSVAKHLNFSRASEELFISQPAVSHHINMLEKELGTTLIIRSKHKVLLTKTGERFYLEMTDVKNLMDTAIDAVRNTDQLPEFLHIGFENIIEIKKLSEIFSEYKEVQPNVRIFCHSLQLEEAIKMFNENKLDILFTTCESINHSSECFIPLFQGLFCCVMRRDDPLASQDRIIPSDLDNRTLIFAEAKNCAPEMVSLQRSLHRLYPSIKVHFSSTAYYSVPMVRAGIGIVLMPEFFFVDKGLYTEDLISVPFVSQTPVQFGILYDTNHTPEKVTSFVKIVKQFYSGKRGCFVK